MTLVEARRLSDPLLLSKIVDYVVNRQNEDGGYSFCQGADDSNAQDIYYELAILKLLKTNFPNVEKTAKFVKEIRFDSIYSIYYATKAREQLSLF